MEFATLIISVLTLLTTIVGIVVSVVLYKKQKNAALLAEQQRKREERQKVQDELDALNEHPHFPMDEFARAKYAKTRYLEKRLSRR